VPGQRFQAFQRFLGQRLLANAFANGFLRFAQGQGRDLQLDSVYDYDPEVELSALCPGFFGFSSKDV
jgi:hypothetical protein